MYMYVCMYVCTYVLPTHKDLLGLDTLKISSKDKNIPAFMELISSRKDSVQTEAECPAVAGKGRKLSVQLLHMFSSHSLLEETKKYEEN